MNISKYVVTLDVKPSGGSGNKRNLIDFTLYSTSEDQSVKVVMETERCPRRCIVGVKEVTS